MLPNLPSMALGTRPCIKMGHSSSSALAASLPCRQAPACVALRKTHMSRAGDSYLVVGRCEKHFSILQKITDCATYNWVNLGHLLSPFKVRECSISQKHGADMCMIMCEALRTVAGMLEAFSKCI